MKIIEGGKGSGNYGHGGRPGEVGGSSSVATDITYEEFKPNSLNPDRLEPYSGLWYYVRHGHLPINNYLRTDGMDDILIKNSAGKLFDTEDFVKEIDLQFTQKLTRDIYVYRGIHDMPRWELGKEFIDKGFVSTGISPDTAAFFVENINTVFRIKVPKGTPVIMIKGTEDEILLPRNLKFKVTSNWSDFEVTGNNVSKYDLEIVN